MLEQLHEFKLADMARSSETIVQMPLHQQPEARTLLAQLTQAEKRNRVAYKTQFYLKLSKLMYAALVEESSCSKERNSSKDQLFHLSDCSYLDHIN